MINKDILLALSEKSPLLATKPEDLYMYSNRQNKAGLQQGFPPAGVHKFLNQSEEDRSIPNYPKDFSYHINDIGFRDFYPDPSSTKGVMGFFGDSCTFGEGLPTEDLFVTHVSKHFNKTCLNLGSPGSSASRIALVFAAASRVWDIDTAVITFPNWARFLYVCSENLMHNVLPPHKLNPTEVENVRKSLILRFSNQHLMFAFKDAVCYIIATAREKNIKLYFGSWDEESIEIIKSVTRCESLLYTLDLKIETARDNVHPGPRASLAYAKKIIDKIEREDYVKTR